MATSASGGREVRRSNGRGKRVVTEGIARTRERRGALRAVAVATASEHKEAIAGSAASSSGGSARPGATDGGGKKKKKVPERGNAGVRDEKSPLEALKKAVGAGVWEELGDDEDAYERRLTEMRRIAQWEGEREPIAIYDSNMAEYSGFTRNVKPEEQQQWQAFIRHRLRGATRPELLELLSEATGEVGMAIVEERYDAVRKDDGPRDWRVLGAGEIESLVIAAAEEDGILRQQLVAAQPNPGVTLPRRPSPHKAFASYFPGPDGAEILARLHALGIRTRDQLRAASDDVQAALEPEGGRDLYTREVGGTKDRQLRMLYEAGAPTSSHQLSRYHAVYEWSVAKQDARDTEVASWTPWLQAGARVTLKMTYAMNAALGVNASQQRWSTHATLDEVVPEDALGPDHIIYEYVLLKGTVLTFRPESRKSTVSSLSPSTASSRSSSSSSSSSSAQPPDVQAHRHSPSCVVLLDPDQFPWMAPSRQPPEERRRLVFVSQSADDDNTVDWYMLEHADSWNLDTPFAHVTWDVVDKDRVLPALSGIRGPAIPYRLCIQVPARMLSGLARALDVSGERIRVSRSISIPNRQARSPPFTTIVSDVQGRVLHGTRSRGAINGLKLWVDGHVVDFASRCAPFGWCHGCEIETLVGERTESPDTIGQLHVSYSLSLVGSLRAQLQRAASKLSAKVGNYAPLADLVTHMLL